MSIKTPYYYLMGNYRGWRGYWRGAARQFIKAVDASPESSRWKYRLALAQFRDKQYENALANIDEAIKNEPQNNRYQILKLSILMRTRSYDEVDSMCQDMLPVSPSYEVWRFRADAALELGRLEDALSYYQQAIKHVHSVAEKSYLYHSIGHIYETQGDADESVKNYEMAVQYSNSQLVRLVGVGCMHYARGWYDSAVAAYRQRLKDEPDNAELYFQLGKVYSKMLRTTKAAGAYKSFTQLDSILSKEGHILDKKLVVFDAFMGRSFSDSPKAIYLQMLKDKRYKDYKFVWVFRGSSWRRYWRFYISRRTKVVGYKTHEYFRAYARAKYWVTNSRIPFVLKTNDEQVYVQCWHGTPLKKMGHSIVSNTQASKYDKDGLVELYDHETKRFDYLLSPSHAASGYLSDAFGLKQLGKENIIIEEGYPRNDFLKNFTTKDVSRVKKQLSIPDGKRVLLYAPTWRDDQHDDDRGYTYKAQVNFDYLREQLGDEWVILFRAHYFIANGFNFRKYQGFVRDVSNVEDVNDLYIVSDVLMTDYSSVFFDYANLHRPIIFFMYDLDHYQKDLRGFYIDIKSLPGDIITDEPQVVKILSSLDDYTVRHEEAYLRFNSVYNYLDDGTAASKVIKRVLQ